MTPGSKKSKIKLKQTLKVIPSGSVPRGIMIFTDILFEKRGNVALITLNRPELLNAFRKTTMRDFLNALQQAAGDEEVRVVVVTGSGRGFSAGADLTEMEQIVSSEVSLAHAREHLKSYQNVTRQMIAMPKPIIAALNGLAVGVGAEIALASDIRLAAENVYFSFAEVKRSLFETNGVMYILPRLVGMGRAAAMMLTGDKVFASDAFQMGLVTQVFPAAELLPAAFEMAQRIADNAPISVRLIKQVLQRTYDSSLEAVMLLEEDGMMECLASDDLREGVRAFNEKRAPRYQGK